MLSMFLGLRSDSVVSGASKKLSKDVGVTRLRLKTDQWFAGNGAYECRAQGSTHKSREGQLLEAKFSKFVLERCVLLIVSSMTSELPEVA